ncbi:MAG: Gfo/Idh/MocA family oxidoreductase [Candidatus Hydrogenedentes bacterium]|nr:Gfo/Idh/MocA family oxidoreductase [Candidatus Hydrogenedentota bacterium]
MTSVTRRTFLKRSAWAAASGAAASGAVAAGAAAGAEEMGANDRITVGIIGCRNRGATVGSYMLRTGGVDVAAVCDCDDEMLDKALAEKLAPVADKIRREKDFRRLLDDKSLDAVVVATPDHWHAQMTVMALDAGKHVYLEKPASFNIQDGKAMVAAQAKHPDRVVQVGTQQRSGQHFMDAKAFIAEGGLGKVAFCRATFITERHTVPVVADSEPPAGLDYPMWIGPAPMRPYNVELLHYNWHFLYDFGTGDMGNWGAHWLDVLRWLLDLDLPTSAAAYGGQFVNRDAKEWPDTQTVLYQFPEMTLLWELRHWSRFMPGAGRGNCCEIDGDKGSMLIDRGGWKFYPRARDAEGHEHPPADLELAHVRSFAAAVRGEAGPAAPIVEGHKSAILCHLGNIAARLNRSVQFDPAREAIVGDAEAEAMMGREYRAPWSLAPYV